MKISSEETKKLTGLKDAGLRKLRKIYQKDKRLKSRMRLSQWKRHWRISLQKIRIF